MNNDESITIKSDDTKKGGTWGVDEEHIRNLSTYIAHTWRGKFLYALMRVLLFIEGIIWTVMDIVRGVRMKVAAKINNNYKFNDRN